MAQLRQWAIRYGGICRFAVGPGGLLRLADMRQQQRRKPLWLFFMGQVAQAREAGDGWFRLSRE